MIGRRSFSRPSARSIKALARERFGWKELRAGQLEAVQTLLDGHDALVVMPTGAGKSAVYQLAALLLDGPTVVVSPLIALQRDQVAGLAARGSGKGMAAVTVNSAQTASRTEQAWESLQAGDTEFVFLAPEQLAHDAVVEKLAAAGVSLLVVDEAHCVSAWGHDFRPDYLRIPDVLDRLGNPRVVGLTATAAPPVRAEIVERLRMRDAVQIVQGFDRPNLRFEVERFVEARDKEKAVVDAVARQEGRGLVYTATRKETEHYAAELSGRGIRAEAYHAGLKAAEREKVHEAFRDGGVDVVVATSAFGMGIDLPDLRYVVHADVAESLDSYYQEVGRAGRDGGPALALLHYRSEDLGLKAFYASGSADEETLRQVAAAVRKHDGPTEPSELGEKLGYSHTRLTNAVNLLEQAGAVHVDGDGNLTYADPEAPVGAAVAVAEEVAQSHERMDRSRVEMMRGYAETSGCRRQFLLGYFGEALPEPCGNCDTCTSGSAYETEAPGTASTPFPLNAKVRHHEWGEGVVMRPEPDRVTVLFDSVGYRTLSLAAVEEHGILVLE